MYKKPVSRDFISNYEVIREILRDIFLYGCYTVDDFVSKGISASKYNADKRRILAFIDNKLLGERTLRGKKALCFTADMFAVSHNFLIESYGMKSFVENEARLSLLVLQLAAQAEEPLSRKEVLEKLSEAFDDDYTDENTLYRILRQLAEQGYISELRDGNRKTYSIADDIFAGFSSDAIRRLTAMADFFTNVIYPSTCGGLLYNTLLRYGGEAFNNYESPFITKHNHMGHVLDDQIFWDVLIAINNKKSVSFFYRIPWKAEPVHFKSVIPLRLIADEQYGRRYLAGLHAEGGGGHKIFRLDRISELLVEERTVHQDISALDELLRFSLLGNTFMEVEGPCLISLRASRELSAYFERALPLFVKADYDGDSAVVSIMINDPTELKPLLRQYIGQVEILGEYARDLAEDMEAERKEWLAQYEAVQ